MQKVYRMTEVNIVSELFCRKFPSHLVLSYLKFTEKRQTAKNKYLINHSTGKSSRFIIFIRIAIFHIHQID